MIVEVDSGERRAVEIDDADVTWLEWRPNGGLAYTALRRGDAVFGDIDPITGERNETWSTEEAVGAGALCGALGVDGFAFVRQGFDRPVEVAVVEGGTDLTVASFAHEVSSTRGAWSERSGSPGTRRMGWRSTATC